MAIDLSKYPQEFIVEYCRKGTTKIIERAQVPADNEDQAKEAIRNKVNLNFIVAVYPAERSSIEELEGLFDDLLDANLGIYNPGLKF